MRLGLYYHSPSFLSFQLTHSRGVRRLLIICVKRWTDISTHALTWSATIHIFKYHVGIGNFNSRTHVECDYVSTMARASNVNFNSRTHVECDGTLKICQRTGGNFNSRTHVECDRKAQFEQFGEMHFNSRTHVECDLMFDNVKNVGQVFQLTHSRGVRRFRT